MLNKVVNLVCIGGSDPSGGAGIQADVRAATVLGANCFSVVTAVTSQNSVKFFDAVQVPPKMIKSQLECIFDDFAVDAVTIGMVYDADSIRVISSFFKNTQIPIILDPVIKSTTGGVLLKKNALGLLKKTLIPLSYVVTPNVFEAELLSGIKINKYQDLVLAAENLSSKNVIITGHSLIGGKISDFVYEDGRHYSISGKKIPGENRGSGCNFAVALAYSIAKKNSLKESVEFAKQFTSQAIKYAERPGRGFKLARPKMDKAKLKLQEAIYKFAQINNAYSLIPEVQTNFVFATKNPRSLKDVVGVQGRIVRAGRQVVAAGTLEYGASRHVATALLVVRKKFPQIRSAINLKFDQKLIAKFEEMGAKILWYDRTVEPPSYKAEENKSVSWGVGQAIKNSKVAPDVIYHTGDVGKEPMILVFGTDPLDVVDKISKLTPR